MKFLNFDFLKQKFQGTDQKNGSLFFRGVQSLASRLAESPEKDWILFTEEPGQFAAAFLALLYSGKNIHLPGVCPEKSLSSRGFPVLSDNASLSRFSLNGIDKDLTDDDRPEQRSKLLSGHDCSSLIIFYTSGSTGQPKEVPKTLNQIESELSELNRLWGDQFHSADVYTTVSHQHFYGILFSILMPLVAGGRIHSKRLHYPESLDAISGQKICLVSSPAFLKRISTIDTSSGLQDKKEMTGIPSLRVFSSGGFLPPQVAEANQRFFGTPIREIYGSTETGGIAWKDSPVSVGWRPFDVVAFNQMRDDEYAIRSPYLGNDEPYSLDDKIEFMEDGTFTLHGRKDSVVKVEEKRVALNDIENRLLETGLVTDAAVFMLEGKRQYIAAALELNENGLTFFEGAPKRKINAHFRQFLSAWFHPTVLPKKWRYPKEMPVNSQGKIQTSIVKTLFETELIDQPEILSEEAIENGWRFVLRFPENYRYFDGHFPEMKILPAVVQIDWIMKTAVRKMGSRLMMVRMPRIKFQSPVFPNKDVSVKFTYQKEKSRLSFEFRTVVNGEKCSGGSIQVKEIQ